MSSHLCEKNGITLRGRWREELEAVSADGTLVFEFTMGKEHVYFPDEKAWAAQRRPGTKRFALAAASAISH